MFYLVPLNDEQNFSPKPESDLSLSIVLQLSLIPLWFVFVIIDKISKCRSEVTIGDGTMIGSIFIESTFHLIEHNMPFHDPKVAENKCTLQRILPQ